MKPIQLGALVVTAWGALSLSLSACGPDSGRGSGIHTTGDMAGQPNTNPDYGDDSTGDGGLMNNGDGGVEMTHDPATCAEAAMTKSYIGCDYWPTVTGNAVWSVFDYAVVVSNPGATAANVTVSGGALGSSVSQMVMPGALVKIGLPWVTALKGPDADAQGIEQPMTASVKAVKGAYHLVSDVPVLVYQFNALEYQAGSGKNLNNVNWSTCPASGPACLSYSNDASLLLPSTAMTPNYVVTGVPGDDINNGGMTMAIGSSYAVITATVDNTTITMQLSKTGDILASSDAAIAAVAQNATTPAKVMYTLNAGDVLELLGNEGSGHDLTGSIIEASQPIQLIVGIACTTNPSDFVQGGFPAYSCDHIEETVLPVETWGKQYVVTSPTGPNGDKPGHSVRIYGGTMTATLTVTPAVAGVPATIAPGQVVKFDTTTDFFISGDQSFAVSSEQMSGEIVDPLSNNPKGDPAMTFLSAVEQYRDKYLFLAPTDYDVNYVDIAAPDSTTLTLDGAAVSTAATSIGHGYSVTRVKLSAGTASGAHTLAGSAPFGIQVMGYGAQTSYQYPGGLDLKVISTPPPIL